MNKSNISVGLDIGTTKIVAMVGNKNEFNKVEILGIGKSKSLGVHRGVVNNITQQFNRFNKRLMKLKQFRERRSMKLLLELRDNTFAACNIAITSRDQTPKTLSGKKM